LKRARLTGTRASELVSAAMSEGREGKQGGEERKRRGGENGGSRGVGTLDICSNYTYYMVCTYMVLRPPLLSIVVLLTGSLSLGLYSMSCASF